MSLNIDKSTGGHPVNPVLPVLPLNKLVEYLYAGQGTAPAPGATVAQSRPAPGAMANQNAGPDQPTTTGASSVQSQASAMDGVGTLPPLVEHVPDADLPQLLDEKDPVAERPRDDDPRLRDDAPRERGLVPVPAVLLDARSVPGLDLSQIGAALPPAAEAQPATPRPGGTPVPGQPGSGAAQPGKGSGVTLAPAEGSATSPASPSSPNTPSIPSAAGIATAPGAPGAPAAAAQPVTVAGVAAGTADTTATAATTPPAASAGIAAQGAPAAATGTAGQGAPAAAALSAQRGSATERGAAQRDGQAIRGTATTQAAATPQGGHSQANASPTSDAGPGQDTSAPQAGRDGEATLSLSQSAKDASALQTANTANQEAGQSRSEASTVTRKLAEQVRKVQQQAQAAARAKESVIRVALPSFGEGQSVVARQVAGQLPGQWTLHASSQRVAQAISRATAPEGVDIKLVMDAAAAETADATDPDQERRRRQQGRDHA